MITLKSKYVIRWKQDNFIARSKAKTNGERETTRRMRQMKKERPLRNTVEPQS